jgi:hypothetical protein
MSQNSSPPPPPQMRNDGPPPAHLSTPSLSDPSGWLQYKWLQPPPCAPDWVFDDYQKFNPLANVGRLLCDEEWLQQALCKDQQAVGLLPPKLPRGPILLGACARAERAYKDWKWAVNKLWEYKHHCLQLAARQHLLDEHAAHERQEAACQEAAHPAQCLLYKCAAHERQEAACQEAAHAAQSLLDLQAALERQEAMHCQCILNKEATSRQCAAHARQMAAAQIIFLWLRCQGLHTRLACQTLRRQQREAALARLQHEQECCARMLQAEEQHKQVAAAQAKAIADKANERHRQAKAAIGEQRQQAASTREKALAQAADKQCPHKAATASAELALIKESSCHKALMWASLSAASSLADKQHHHEASKLALALVELTLANERCRHKAAEQSTASVELALAEERHCHEAAMQTAMSAKSSLANEHCHHKAALAEDKRRQEGTAKKQCRSDDECIMAPVLPPDPVNAAIRHIRVECALLAAPLDAILAKIERDNIAHEAQAPPTTTLPHPAAMLSTPPLPYDLCGHGPFYDRGEHLRNVPCSGTIGHTIAYC